MNDVIGRAVAVKRRVITAMTRLPGLGVGDDCGEVGVAMASAAAGEFVVGAVVTGFGVDDEVAAGEGVEDHVDETGASDDGTFQESAAFVSIASGLEMW